MGLEILTIGHSTLSSEDFTSRLHHVGVTAIADVRSAPFSRRFPHFNKDTLKAILKESGIKYVFLGKELGGRPREDRLFVDGLADYEKMATENEFLHGVDRVIEGARRYRIALMCSEKSPFECHRCLLVGRTLARRGVRVGHILGSGDILGHEAIEERLLEMVRSETDDFFITKEQRIARAYNLQARRVAFQKVEVSHG